MTRPRSERRQSLLDRLWIAQDKCCYLCGTKMYPIGRFDPNRGWSADHVKPRAAGHRRTANVLLAHSGCNRLKADRLPTACELLFLDAVNERLGICEPEPVAYADPVTYPSTLAVALQSALAA